MSPELHEEARAWPHRSTSTTVLELRGLTADNLLAFLALLGLMRAVEAERPEWHPRTSWFGVPWRARLHVTAPANNSDIGSTVREAMCRLADAYYFGARRKVDFSTEDFFRLNVEAHTIDDYDVQFLRLELLAALGCLSSTSVNIGGFRFYKSALILADGDSQNFFLERLQKLWRYSVDASDKCSTYIEDALFRPWLRNEAASKGALRWDYAEARPYAHRARAPNDDRIDPPSAELGAVILASLGMTACSVVPGSRTGTTVAMARYGEGATFTWPLWTVPIGLASALALLRHPKLAQDVPDRSALEPYGVSAVMRATVASVARLKVFGPGEPLWGAWPS